MNRGQIDPASRVYRLYYYPGNANLAPHILLEEAGAPYELVLVDRTSGAQKAPEYLRLNPNGRIPTLVDGELVLFEAAAICLHIADRHPEAELAPAPGSADRSLFHQWLIFLTNTIQPDYMAFRYPENFTTDPGGVAAVRDRAEQRLAAGFEVLERALRGGPYLVGHRYTACDAYLFMLCTWARRLSTPPAELPGIRRALDTTAVRPAVERAFSSEGLGPRAYASRPDD